MNRLIQASFRSGAQAAVLPYGSVGHMIRLSWLIVLAAGMLAALVRVVGPSSAADAAAMAYLILATVTFGWPRNRQVPRPVPVRHDLRRR